jgi:mRNA interferase MazF
LVIQRGEIWWAALPEPVGSSPGYSRPILIIQSNDFNQSRIGTVIAVVITSNAKLAQAPGNIFLPKKISSLPKDSVVNVSQIITIDKSFLTQQVGFLPSKILEQVEMGLRLVLSL